MRRLLLFLAFLPVSWAGAAPLENLSLSPQELQKLSCIVQGCGAKQRLLDIPDAENILFLPDGRLFVSGGQNVYEVSRSGETFQARPLLGDGQTCNFTGLAYRPGVSAKAVQATIYAVCGSGAIFAANVRGRQSAPVLREIARITNAALPNGAVVAGDYLYVVNGPITQQTPAKIMRFPIAARDPLLLGVQEDWLSAGLYAPNGLDARFDTGLQTWHLYFTDGGGISRVAVRGNGFPGDIETLYYRGSHLDDITLVEGGILAADYFAGSVALISYQGELLRETAAGTFVSASHVHPAVGRMFPQGGILVTEKGILGEHESKFGNALSVFRWEAE